MKKFLPLLFSLSLASIVSAHAETKPASINCEPTGVNLFDALQKSDPAAWQDIQNQAAGIPNSKGTLWKVEKDGVRPSYLFGTMHMGDPRIMEIAPAAKQAYDNAETVVIETTDILDPKAFLRIKVEQPNLLSFTDDTSLITHLPQDRVKDIEEKLAKRGIILGAIAKVKPWIVYSMLVMPKCELKRQAAGGQFLDTWIAKNAEENGKSVVGLETALEQLEAMDSLPLDFQMRSFVATVDNGERMEDAMETMLQLYKKGDIGLIMPAFRKTVPDDFSDTDYDQVLDILVVKRNHKMVKRAGPILEKGNAFIAVGALHLPGEEGLVQLLKNQGYKVTAQ